MFAYDATAGYKKQVPTTPLARITLTDPVCVFAGIREGTLVDLSLSGAQVEHRGALHVGTLLPFHLEWRGQSIVVEAEVVRCVLHRNEPDPAFKPVYRTGLAFQHYHGNSLKTLRAVMIELVERSLAGEKAASRCSETVPASSRFLRLRLVRGLWVRELTDDAKQPEDGFTVPSTEELAQIKLLCAIHEKLAPADQGLIRILAALRVQLVRAIDEKPTFTSPMRRDLRGQLTAPRPA